MSGQKFYIFKTYDDEFHVSDEFDERGMFQVSIISQCTERCEKCGATVRDMLVTDNSCQEYGLLYLCLDCLQPGLEAFKAVKE